MGSVPFKNICVFGLGGVGGYFGGKMASSISKKNGGENVSFIARGEHLSKIKENGLLLDTSEGKIICWPNLATELVSEIPSPDLVLLCTKSYGLENAVRQMEPKLTNQTLIIPLLNGVDITERIRKVTSKGIVLPSCTYIVSYIGKPGEIVQRGKLANILSGIEPGRDHFNPENLVRFFHDMEIRFTWNQDPFPTIWEKYVFIASYSIVTAYSEKTYFDILNNAQYKGLLTDIINEIVGIAKAKHISLPADIAEISVKKGLNVTPESKTSYQRDVETKGKLSEGDIYGETIVRMGIETGIPTPVTARLYREIQNKLTNK
jgi:2-dehydropantoate 2-reductase